MNILGAIRKFLGIFSHKDWLTRTEAADLIDRFINNESRYLYEWTDFLDGPYEDPLLDKVVGECWSVHDEFPQKGAFCSAEGMLRLAQLRDLLRAEPPREENAKEQKDVTLDYEQYDQVELAHDMMTRHAISKEPFLVREGTRGVIVEIFSRTEAGGFCVEFFSEDGNTVALMDLSEQDMRPLHKPS